MNSRTWARIEGGRERWNVLRHPFYRRWSAGDLSADDLARYSGQYRHAVVAIAELSESAADALPQRRDLRSHAAEEREHVALWDGFVDAAGGRARDEPTAETSACVNAWIAPATAGEALVRLYAIESGQPEISLTKRAGLVDRYGFMEGDATAYFRVHEGRDVEHAAAVRELIDEIGANADEDRLAAAAEAAFRANWRLLDGV